MRNFLILFSFILILCITKSNAQYNNLKFESFSTAEGLSSSTCLDIFQDSRGFLWFGTIDGLNMYDGYSFKIYRPSINNHNSISNNRVNSITEDSFGNLWIGTSNGLNVFNTSRKKFFQIDLYKQVIHGNTLANTINDVFFDASKDEIWVATGNGACKISILNEIIQDSSNYSLNFYVKDKDNDNSLDNNVVTNILKDRNNDIWIATEGDKLNKYQPQSDNFKHFSIDLSGIHEWDNLPKVLLEDHDGDFWIGNDLSSLILWDRTANSFNVLKISKKSIPVFDIYRDSKNIYWIATDGHGIFIFDKSKGIINHLLHDENNPFSLPNNQISKVIEDVHGIFWLATYNEGISKLVLSKSSFEHYFHIPGSANSLSSAIAQAVLMDKSGQIWIGTDGGGLTLFNEKQNTYKHFKANGNRRNTISSNKILYLEESHNGNIWVCTWDGGLNLFDPLTEKTKVFEHNPYDANTIGQNTVWCATEDKNGGLWLGTQTSGLNYLIPDTDEFIQFENDPLDTNSLMSNFVFSLFIDSKERLLIGTAIGLGFINIDGVYEQNLKNLSFTPVKHKNILGKRINYITEDKRGNIWLGSDLGLHKLDSNFNYQVSYSTEEGLPNNLIVGIKEDNYGFLWITSKGGLSRLNPQTNEFRNFNRQDGVQGVEFQSKSIAMTNDGRIIIGGINGINIFDPKNFLIDTFDIYPIITNIRLFNEEIKVGDTINNRVVLKKSLEETKSLKFKHNEGFLSFDFVALYYQNPDKVQFAYRMKKLDENFVFSGTNRTANYSGLPPGEYVFEVKASLNRDWENAAQTSISIVILPPPWRTWWAYILYFLFLSGIVWFSLMYYINKVKEEKERELDQMKLRFFVNVAHEFRTPLTLILNPIDKILSAYNNAELVKESSLIIQRSARKLLSLVNQLLDFRKMDMGKSPLEPQHADLVNFCKDISILFKDLAQIKEIVFSFSSNQDSIRMSFDPDKIEKILTNLLTNAVKFTNKGGQVNISLNRYNNKKTIANKRYSDYVEIKVSDTGVGIKKEHLSKIFNRFFNVDDSNSGTGIGLNFTKSLVEIHEGEISVESIYQEGSTFTVLLPVKNYSNEKNEEQTDLNSYSLNSIQSITYDLSITDSDQNEDLPVADSINAEDKSRVTVLIVEDNKELRVHLKNELSSQFKVREAINGKQGLEFIKNHYPDIVISDVMMPEMDGFEMCRQVKSDLETCHIPVILLTARSLEEDKIEGFKTGADEYLPKPFNIHVLKARIYNLLEIKRKLREKFSALGGIVPSKEITSNTLDEAFLDKATKIVLKNINEANFSLEVLLKEIGVSRSKFYRKISSITGQNPSNFIRTIRLKYASDLLLEGNSSIKEIAYSCGFNSTAYFSKTFRELYKMTPMQYIDKIKKSN